MKNIIALGFCALLLVGCALPPKEPLRVVVENEVRTRVVGDSGRGQPPAMKQASKKQAAALGDTVTLFGEPVRVMAQQIEVGLNQRGIKRLPITVAPFVELSGQGRKRKLGAELAEGFFHELQVRGFNLIDYQPQAFADPDQAVADMGLSDFYRRHRISYVLSGTYTVNSDVLIINARVLDTVTRQVVATGQAQLMAEQLEGRLPGYNPLDSRDGMIVENGGVPLQ